MHSFEYMLASRKELIIGDRYRLIRKIGGGSFGDIFLGINLSDGVVSACNYISINRLTHCHHIFISVRPIIYIISIKYL